MRTYPVRALLMYGCTFFVFMLEFSECWFSKYPAGAYVRSRHSFPNAAPVLPIRESRQLSLQDAVCHLSPVPA